MGLELAENQKVVKAIKPVNTYTGEPIRVLKKSSGDRVAVPTTFDWPDKGIDFYQNITKNENIYVMFPNNLVMEVPYIELEDTEKGIFVVFRYKGLTTTVNSDAKLEVTEKFFNHLLLDEFYKYARNYNTVIKKRFIDGNADRDDIAKEFEKGFSNDHADTVINDLKMILKSHRFYTDYKFISQNEFGDADSVIVRELGLMFYVGEQTELTYPNEKPGDVINSGVSITIRNSKNPHKKYYANILGNVVTIPVKRDGKEDGITIVKTFKGSERVLTYDLEEAESLGIYSNYEDAEINHDRESRLKIAEYETKMAMSENSVRASELKLELEKLNMEHTTLRHEYDKAKLEWETNKMRLEKEKKEAEEKMENIRREKEKEILELERRASEEKLKQEMLKAELQREKSDNEKTISLYKTVATVVTGVLTIVGAIWKFF